MMYDELVNELRVTERICRDRMDGTVMLKAADAIEDLDFSCNRYEKDYKALCEYLPKWIPVTERLPNENDDVIIYGEWTGASGTKYRGIWLTDLKGFLHQGYKPIAWMPLPEPPKEET